MEMFVAALRQVSEALRWKTASLPTGPIRRLSSKLISLTLVERRKLE